LSGESRDPEARIDQLTGLRTLLAPGRADRPGALQPPGIEAETDPADCPFCEGNESKTPPELDAVRPEGGEANGPGWISRTVPNLYPALAQTDADAEAPAGGGESGLSASADPLRAASRSAEPDLFSSRPARGSHEVIVHGPEHHVALSELEEPVFAAAIDAWRARMKAHADVPYTQLIVNEGRSAGASLEHSHAQLYALDFVPTDVARERERFNAYAERTMGGELLQDIGTEEVRRKERLVAIDDEAMLICPWASRGAFELRVLPRRAAARFAEDGTGTAMIRTALRVLAKRFDAPPPLNMWVRTAPQGTERFHWHVDVLPRLAVRAGFEMGVGVEIATYEPERAAAELRDCVE
jgi:UDPglucose--hexose-1-phosphate uridylyltransferase